MKCGNTTVLRARLRDWYRKNPGQWLQQEECRQLESVLPDLFGYYLLQIGVNYCADYLQASRIPFCAVLDIEPSNLDVEGQAVGSEAKQSVCIDAMAECLPFASDSLDLLILQHALEFSENPHEVLREVDRTLIPEGHVIVLGFNPWGLWMLWRLVLGWRKRPPWCGRFVGPARLRDWLQLLGFDVVEQKGYFFRPPIAHQAVMEKLLFMDRWGPKFWPFFSGAYMVIAKKRVATLTPIKPRWRPRRNRLAAPELAGNSSSVSKILKKLFTTKSQRTQR